MLAIIQFGCVSARHSQVSHRYLTCGHLLDLNAISEVSVAKSKMAEGSKYQVGCTRHGIYLLTIISLPVAVCAEGSRGAPNAMRVLHDAAVMSHMTSRRLQQHLV